MFRLVITIAALAGSTAFAAPPADDAQTAPGNPLDVSKPYAIKPTSASAAPNQVFPPIPAFASLPPTTNDGSEDAPAAAETHHGKKGRRAPARKAPELAVHVVVSDESHAYLTNVETQLDVILQNGQRDRHLAAGPESVALSH
jgi:hypothetical protein